MQAALIMRLVLTGLVLLIILAVVRRGRKPRGTVVRIPLKEINQRVLGQQPDCIHLSRHTGFGWQNQAAVEELAAQLLARGFSEIGDFAIAEMHQVLVRFLMKASDSVYACIYEHPKAGNWVEVISRYQDGTGVTFTTARDRGLEHRPEDKVVHAPGLSPEALYARMLKERPQGKLVSLSAECVIKLFEDVCREQIKWRKERGLTAAEVARVAATRAGAS